MLSIYVVGDSSGRDVASNFTYAKDVEDLNAVVEIKDTTLLGHSMGAFISAIVASVVLRGIWLVGCTVDVD